MAMTKRKPLRPRIHPYLAPDLMARLDEYVAARGVSESAIVGEALEQLLGGQGERDVLYRRLDAINRRVEGSRDELSEEITELRRHVVAQGQLLRLLLVTWLNGMSPSSPEKRPKPGELYRQVMETLGHQVLAGRTLFDELPPEVRETLAAQLERDVEQEAD
jgi:hypothetical protein